MYHSYEVPKHLKHYEKDENLMEIVRFRKDEWLDKGSYFLSIYPQGSDEWLSKRVGRITQSNMGKVVGDAPYFKGPPEQLAKQLVGIEKEEFSEEAKKRMNIGTKLEPAVRKYMEEQENKKIEEVGLAVWKEDPRFGASLDGEISKFIGLEIKCPAKMYAPLIERIEFPHRFPDHDNSFMWKSHLYQVIGNMIITGKQCMVYVVYAHEEEKIFRHSIYREDVEGKWKNYLYPTACKFYDQFMYPLLSSS